MAGNARGFAEERQFSQAFEAGSTNTKPRYRIGSQDSLVVNLQTCNGCAPDGWGWIGGAYWLSQKSSVSFSTGSQVMRVQTREDGVQIDQIVLSPELYADKAPGAAIATPRR